ncbi:MAG: DUF2175 domain-containing protein [Aeropyrum sp.]|nr:DUF2175 domain-containing protein [Aeropyrum sp.]
MIKKMRKKWSCYICGGEVIEGQRFTFLPEKGAVHVECLNKEFMKVDPSPEIIALLDANEALLYTIVRLKEAGRIAESEEAKSLLDNARREVERLAGILAREIAKHSNNS